MDRTTKDSAGSEAVRWGAAGWCCAALFSAMGAGTMALAVTQTMDTGTKILLGVYILVISGMSGWFAATSFERIDADEKGIRWRTWRGVKRIAWDEVSDYYLLPPRDQGKRLVVETKQGTIRIPMPWMGVGAFQDAVRTFATSATAKDWAILGCRAVEPTPLVFSYDTRWSFAPVIVSTAIALLTGVGMRPHGHMDVDLITRYVGLGWALGFMALLWIFPTLVILLLAIPFTRIAADTRRRKRDTVTVTSEGISFTGNSKKIAARWTEIASWSLSNPHSARPDMRLSIETGGGTFDASAQLRDFRLLAAILRYRCGDQEVATQDIENLLPDTTQWDRGSAESGHVVHHYRTRSNRMFMLAPWILLVSIGAIRIGIRHLDLPGSHANDPSPVGLATMFAAILVGAVWMTLHYYRDAIVADDEGITQISIRGSRRLLWSEVESYRYSDSRAVLRGGKTAISFSEMIFGFADLFRTVEKRAVNSRNTMWNTIPKGHDLDDLPAADRPENCSLNK